MNTNDIILSIDAEISRLQQAKALLTDTSTLTGAKRGCKPQPPKILSQQIEPRHDRIQVDKFRIATKSVMAVQMDVAPSRRRHPLD
jgi:hypothetical protein